MMSSIIPMPKTTQIQTNAHWEPVMKRTLREGFEKFFGYVAIMLDDQVVATCLKLHRSTGNIEQPYPEQWPNDIVVVRVIHDLSGKSLSPKFLEFLQSHKSDLDMDGIVKDGDYEHYDYHGTELYHLLTQFMNSGAILK